ncbi:Tyrosine recombinase XerD [Burkholderia multivorans]|uniref:site-specific integrase n=1 Tax=Burkholderia cepacia complex TaxID=87882 RepID=UPI001C9617F3|nr:MULTISPECIES: site-specific integrase [Burkholderia cepacia complex]MBY4834059.1 site-specific integrase [Burkholderia dolosa]MDR8746647.1 Tyrosine recombinase XerD [Burkholderia multivorans]MDR8805516.1 Tyrosine recombinase XerD [Burkholderia multivorans]
MLQNTYQNRHGTYYIRLFVPQALLPHVQQPKLVQSLRTKDRKQAYLRSLQVALSFEKWVAEMKKIIGIGDHRDLSVTLPNGTKLDFNMQIEEERSAYQDTISQIGLLKQPITASNGADATTPHGSSRYRLVDLFGSYKVAKEKVFAEATQAAYFPRIEKFIDYYRSRGVIFIDEIHKPQAGDYRELIIKDQDSPLTVDNYTKTLKGFFDFAIGAGKYPFENPFSNMHLVKKSERSKHTDSWLPYSNDEIQRLFVENFSEYVKRFKKPDLFFAPLISLTTGMRVDEIAQLYISDIYQEGGVWVFDINDNGEDKEVKTPSAVRKMPFTSDLLLTNFLEYYQLVKSTYGETSLLFPYLTKTASNGYAKNISYNWTQYKKQLITVDQSQKVFHSLRKTVGASLVDLQIDLPIRKRILGHSMEGDITQTVYGKEYPIEFIRSILDKIDHGVDFKKFQFKFKNEKILEGLVNKKSINERKKSLKEKEKQVEE